MMFRRRALERVASPEELDRLVQVALPRRWLALGALLVVLGGTIAWACISSVPTTLTGPGYLLPLSGLRAVQAPIGGTVSSLSMAVGEHVVKGQRIGTVSAHGRGSAAVLAPETGVVTEADAVTGAYAATGSKLGLVEPVGWPLVVYAYVPTQIAADLSPGTPVHVSFGAGISAAYGYAQGTVESVSQFPATGNRLRFILQDVSVIAQVRGLGPANEVVVQLDESATSPNGLVWGSGSGPPTQLPAGLPATATFIVGSHHPISDVL
jgi:multidrug efflux pump subunit AcrA (membrane-fusion protein)